MKSKQTKAKVLPHLVAWVRIGRGIPHGKVFVSLSHPELFQRINALKKGPLTGKKYS
jgi:hypothetical protein